MKSTLIEIAVALTRSVELSILWKATVMLALGLTAARLAGRARASRRHLLLATTFATLLALPLIVLTPAPVTIELSVSHAADSVAALGATPTSAARVPPAGDGLARRTTESGQWSLPSWPTVVRAGWLAGVMLLFALIAFDLRRLRRLCRDGLPWPESRDFARALAAEYGVRRPVEVLLHEQVVTPLTCGAWRPVILLPADAREWDEADLRRALVHELEHVRRGDWATQLVARAACAFYWFHPLVWVAWRRLGLEAERACDDAVVRGAERTEYAAQLVSLARRMSKGHAHAALGMAKRSDLSARVTALLDGGQRRGRAGLSATVGVVCVASLVVTAVASVRAVARAETSPVAVNQTASAQTKDERSRRPSPLDEALYEAAEDGDGAEIERLLAAGANVNCAIDGDGSPLIAAARAGHLEAVRLLLERGADPNMPVEGDGNPLIMAAREGHTDVVALLLDRGAKVDQMVPDDENALIQASGEGHLEVVKLLVARGADVNARVWIEPASERPNGEWRSPLAMARKGGHDAVVAYLKSVGARE
ncbi:MAG TPA: M56 family metallopeptidase [Pyrinomonadaceae bacterium]|nr:M56 family metallopeptidase [Pyrinomonadaceae bacterium]